MIISYEMFLRSAEEVRNIKFGLVICDEAHRLKNTTIKTATVSPGTSFPPPPLLLPQTRTNTRALDSLMIGYTALSQNLPKVKRFLSFKKNEEARRVSHWLV